MTKFSVIMPMDRPGDDAMRAIVSILAQEYRDFELLVVSGVNVELPGDPRMRIVLEEDRNPALRRNRAAADAKGEILAFIDDDAFADPRWLSTAAERFDDDAHLVCLGGPDPAPPDSTTAELISDVLLATPLIGSGVACHERRKERFDLRSPHDIALVNLFVRRDAFRALGGFDESVGYVGEDTALIAQLIPRGRVAYDPDVVVFHRRRRFPSAFIRQRWRYRVKTGKLFINDPTYRKNRKILLLLGGGFGFIICSILAPLLAAWMLLLYAFIVIALSSRASRLPPYFLPLLPFLFLIHHGIYFTGVVSGIASALLTPK